MYILLSELDAWNWTLAIDVWVNGCLILDIDSI